LKLNEYLAAGKPVVSTTEFLGEPGKGVLGPCGTLIQTAMEPESKKSTTAKNERELTSTDKIMIGLISAVGFMTCLFIYLKILFL
jgi:hypothetical protein